MSYAITLLIVVFGIIALYAVVLVFIEVSYLQEVKRFEKLTTQQELLALRHLEE